MPDPTCNELATKAELQELRDQLNAILGETEDGETKTIFEKGVDPVIALGGMAGTGYLLTKTRAGDALVDIGLERAGAQQIWEELWSGKPNTQWIATKGNGKPKVLDKLDEVGKSIRDNTKSAKLLSKASLQKANMTGFLADLTTLGATLALNMVTVDVFDKRIEAEARGSQQAIDDLSSFQMKLYEKQQGNLAAIKATIAQNQQAVADNKEAIASTKLQVDQVVADNNYLKAVSNEHSERLATLAEEHAQLQQEISESNVETQEVLDNLFLSTQRTQNSLTRAESIIQLQRQDLDKQEERITLLEARATAQEERITALEAEVEELKQAFEVLELDISTNTPVIQARPKPLWARIIHYEAESRRVPTGGGGVGAVTPAIASTQESLLTLTKKLTKDEEYIPTIYADDVVNNPSKFKTEFDRLLDKVTTGGDVSPEQITNLREDIKTDTRQTIENALKVGGIPVLGAILDRTSQTSISQATQVGICESLNDGSCPVTPTNPNPTQGLKGAKDFLGDKSDLIANALGAANLALGQNIHSIVKEKLIKEIDLDKQDKADKRAEDKVESEALANPDRFHFARDEKP